MERIFMVSLFIMVIPLNVIIVGIKQILQNIYKTQTDSTDIGNKLVAAKAAKGGSRPALSPVLGL